MSQRVRSDQSEALQVKPARTSTHRSLWRLVCIGLGLRPIKIAGPGAQTDNHRRDYGLGRHPRCNQPEEVFGSGTTAALENDTADQHDDDTQNGSQHRVGIRNEIGPCCREQGCQHPNDATHARTVEGGGPANAVSALYIAVPPIRKTSDETIASPIARSTAWNARTSAPARFPAPRR